MNSYVSLSTLKALGTLGITGTQFDDQLLRTAEVASRKAEKDCDRFFYIWEGIRYYDGASVRAILDDDVFSITSLDVDTDGSGNYASNYDITSAVPDAFLYPLNVTPKTRLEANPQGQYGHFGSGFRKAIRITGQFGYGNDYPALPTHTAIVTLGGALASTDATLNITGNSTGEIAAGMTLRVNSEQVYAYASPTGANNSTCPIQRAVNGTTAGTATSGTAIGVYDYPAAIVQACLIQAVRQWKRRESGFVNTIINTDMGTVQVYKGLDPDIAATIREYWRGRSMRQIG